jgi:hypothetical protein
LRRLRRGGTNDVEMERDLLDAGDGDGGGGGGDGGVDGDGGGGGNGDGSGGGGGGGGGDLEGGTAYAVDRSLSVAPIASVDCNEQAWDYVDERDDDDNDDVDVTASEFERAVSNVRDFVFGRIHQRYLLAKSAATTVTTSASSSADARAPSLRIDARDVEIEMTAISVALGNEESNMPPAPVAKGDRDDVAKTEFLLYDAGGDPTDGFEYVAEWNANDEAMLSNF